MSLLKSAFLLVTLVSLVYTAALSPKLTCRDEAGNPVDWFTMYKLPILSDNKKSVWIPDGSAYAFMTDKSQSTGWTLSAKSIVNATSLPGQTLDLLYKSTFNQNTKLGYILYNDQFDNKSLASHAHAKGILMFDDSTAIWIAHSIPNYPPRQNSGKYSEHIYI